MINETGRRHDFSVANESRMFLRACIGTKQISGVHCEIDEKPGDHPALADIEFTRSWLAFESDLGASRIPQACIEPCGDNFLIPGGVGAVGRVGRRRSLGRTSRSAQSENRHDEEPS